VLQCAAVCCSVLRMLQCTSSDSLDRGSLGRACCAAVCCSVLQYVAVCCSMLQCVAVHELEFL